MNEYANILFKLTIEYEIDNDIKCCDIKLTENDEDSINKFIKLVKNSNSNDKRIQFISSVILNKDIITDMEIKKKFN